MNNETALSRLGYRSSARPAQYKRGEATPPVHVMIQGGLHGDQAAAALVLHAIPRVLAAPPGLTTVLALPPIHYQPRLERNPLARDQRMDEPWQSRSTTVSILAYAETPAFPDTSSV